MDEKVEIKKSNRGGKREGSGRKAGTPNKISATAKESIIEVFDALGGVDNMAVWASDNQTQFYNLYAKLLPLQVTGGGGGAVEVIHTIELVALK